MDKIIFSDIKFIVGKIGSIKKNFKNTKILIVGGTGFIGKWLLLTFDYLNKIEKSNITIFVLTRSKRNFIKKNPEFQKLKSINYINGDILNFNIKNKKINYIIHAGSDLKVNNKDQTRYLKELSIGSKKIFEIKNKNLNPKILFISSGAVYKNNNTKKKIKEKNTFLPSQFSLDDTYSLGKSLAEIYAKLYVKYSNKKIIIVRGFSFVGPYQQFERGFAVTDFIKSSLINKNIHIKNGDNIYRSYLYIADLIIWLLHILTKGEIGEIYNVGSDKSVSLKQLSKIIIKVNKSKSKVISVNKNKSKKINYYIPNINLVKNKLNLKIWTDLNHSIDKTTSWFKNQK